MIGGESRERVASIGGKSRETVASIGRESRETVASIGSDSRETVARSAARVDNLDKDGSYINFEALAKI